MSSLLVVHYYIPLSTHLHKMKRLIECARGGRESLILVPGRHSMGHLGCFVGYVGHAVGHMGDYP